MYKLTAPVEGYTGRVGPVSFANGTAVTDNEAVIAFARRRGYGVEELDVAHVDEEGDGQGDEDETPPERPAKSASKADWVAYAIGQGMSEKDADAATRDALVEHYSDGGDA